MLCDAAEAIRKLAPWKDLAEDELFALQTLPGNEVHFVSVMGQAGAHLALAFYPGLESLMKFRRSLTAAPDEEEGIESILLNSHLQVSFEERAGLFPQELQALKAAGRSYRGLWPAFRSHREARIPWPVDAGEADTLASLLPAAVEVLRRVRRGEQLTGDAMGDEFFMLGADGRDGVCRIRDLPVVRHRLLAVMAPDALAGLERTRLRAEMELGLLLAPLADDRGGAPFLPLVLLLVESQSGCVLGTELLPTNEGVDAALARLPEVITRVIRQKGMVPSVIAARHHVLLSALQAYGKLHRIKVEKRKMLPVAERALQSLKRAMQS